MEMKVAFYTSDIRELFDVEQEVDNLISNGAVLVDVKTDTLLTDTGYPMATVTVLYKE